MNMNMHTTHRGPGLQRLRLVSLALLGALSLSAAWGQGTYPERTIRIITPYDPGSMVDATTRLVAEGLSKRLGQPVVVENRTGGMGMIAMNALLAAPADGYTLLTDTPASAINPTLYKEQARYNPKVDIAPIAQFMKLPFVLAVHPTVKATDAKDLVAQLGKPGAYLNAAVAGTSTGLVTDLFAIQAGVTLTHVPYKGAAPAMLAALKDEAPLILLDAANLAPHIRAGKLKGLLITSEERSDTLREVPTAKEAGFPQFRPATWFGIFARAGVPPQILKQLNASVQEVMQQPRTREYLQSRGAESSAMSLDEFRTFFYEEIDTWAEVIRKAQIKQ
jgi:tripartite-type tricarboxylate transporter receptor subunit TctC